MQLCCRLLSVGKVQQLVCGFPRPGTDIWFDPEPSQSTFVQRLLDSVRSESEAQEDAQKFDQKWLQKWLKSLFQGSLLFHFFPGCYNQLFLNPRDTSFTSSNLGGEVTHVPQLHLPLPTSPQPSAGGSNPASRQNGATNPLSPYGAVPRVCSGTIL